jgi:hypothetical protein
LSFVNNTAEPKTPGVPWCSSLVFLGVSPWCSRGVTQFRGVPSCSKENVLGKDYLLKRNQYKNFHDVINAYRGTSNRIRGVPSCSKENVLGKDHL